MNWLDLTAIALAMLGSIGIAMIVGEITGHRYIFGGSDCSVTLVDGQEVKACYGYPPTGLAVIIVSTYILILLSIKGVCQGLTNEVLPL